MRQVTHSGLYRVEKNYVHNRCKVLQQKLSEIGRETTCDKDQMGEMHMKRIMIPVLIASLLSGCVTRRTIRFGTADSGGLYYAFGTMLSEALNKENQEYELQVKETAGSAANIRLLSEDYIRAGIAQSDVVNEMYYGEELTGNAENGYQGYSAVASLWTEEVQIAVQKDSDIETLDDLENKIVSIGQEDSGSERNARQILSAIGLQSGNIQMENYDYNDAIAHLLDGSIDAMFITAGSPVQIYADHADSIRLLSLSQQEMDRICNTFDGYVKTSIPANTYEGIGKVNTLGVKAVLLVADEAPEDAVYQMCSVLFTNIDTFEQKLGLHQDITPQSASEGITIPFHPGAQKWYQENGISAGGHE